MRYKVAEVALYFPLTLDPNTGNMISTTDQAVIWNNRVRMALETLMGERVMRPTYGAKIPEAVFSTISGMEDILYKDIRKVFIEQLPLLELVSVEATHDKKENRLSVNVLYKLPNKQEITTPVGVIVVSDTNPLYEELN